MGQRMPDKPIEYGLDCIAGWEAGVTPKFVYARFAGIEKCPDPDLIPPNDRTFKVTQEPLTPCDWFYEGSVWRVEFQVATEPDFVYLVLTDHEAGVTHFEATIAGPPVEGQIYQNENLVCDEAHGGKNGIAVVTWTPQATALLEAINLSKGEDLFMELFPLADGKLVYKFCRIAESTNIKILFEPP